MILKEVKHYPDTNSVEATRVDEEGIQIKCHSYADVQMDMLRADLGADAKDYADLIATVEANQKPLPPPDPAIRINEIKAELAALDQKKIRPLAEGDTAFLATLNAQTLTLRKELAAL